MSDNGACIEKNGKEERALYLPAKELRELLYEAGNGRVLCDVSQ